MADAEPRPGAFTDILIPSSTPGNTVDHLYQTSHVLMWNGAAVTGGTPSILTTTGTTTALPLPAGGGTSIIYLNNATQLIVQGIAAGTDGQRIWLVSKGTGEVDLAHQNTSAPAGNRLINFVTGLTSFTPLSPASGVAEFVYDGTESRWRLLSHDQGAWITPTSIGGFTATGAMTWTVPGGSVVIYRSWIKGRTYTFMFDIGVTTIGGVVNTTLLMNLSATAAGAVVIPSVFPRQPFSFINGGGVTGTGVMTPNSSSQLALVVDRSFATNWTLGANCIVSGVAQFELT